MLTAIVLFLFLFVILFDRLTLLKKTDKREKIIYYFLMSISFVILILYSFDISVPSPSSVIKDALDAIFIIAK
jgi:hypothetical protein